MGATEADAIWENLIRFLKVYLTFILEDKNLAGLTNSRIPNVQYRVPIVW